jgi:tetraprenyl-beta-curcumene synthase
MLLSARQLRVLIAAVARELTWSLPAVAREARAWRSLALRIADAPTRQDALSALADKRGHTDGAALFTILPRRPDQNLLRLLVAYEIAWDFLDSVNERGATAGQMNGKQLHMALIDALDPDAPVTDYYRHHPWRGDDSYLRTLVDTCRQCCEQLSGYQRVSQMAAKEAYRAQVLAINHELDPQRRDVALREWAAQAFPGSGDAAWFELSGAASASLTIHALLALAADPPDADSEIELVRGAYFPWISAATTMLDSYVDQLQDFASGDHSYVAHYSSPELRVQRIGKLIERSLREARELPGGERHTLIVACMAAMYLSKDSASSPALRAGTKNLIAAGGPLTRLLLPILRLWRIVYSQRST